MVGRAAWKGPTLSLSLLNQLKRAQEANTVSLSATFNSQQQKEASVVKTTARNCTIIPSMVGSLINVHNGRDYIPLNIREEMVGMKLGVFVATRKPFHYRHTNANKRVVRQT